MAKKLTKRMQAFKSKISDRLYDPQEAFDVLVNNSHDRESIDAVFVLGINGKKSDQVVKGVVEHIPAGLGKKITIALFSKTHHEEAKAAGADFVGFEDLFEKVKKEEVQCDVYLATLDLMPELAKMGLGRILKGKMPNSKFGTVIEQQDIISSIKAQKAGKLAFRSNGSLVHCSIGRASFSSQDLVNNFEAIFKAIVQARPTVIKPHSYVKRIFTSSTTSPSLRLQITK